MSVTAFHSRRTITGGQVKDATVFVEKGKIIKVSGGPEILRGIPLVEFGDNVLMAGVFDPHVHINEPGREDWEGFDTATRAAISGGVTSMIEMPLNASPVTTTVAAFDKKLSATTGKLHANCGFWGGIVPGNAAEIKPLAEKGVAGFKAFLTHSGIDEFPNVTEADLDIAMPVISETGLPLLVHCEITDDNFTAFENPRSYMQYLGSRPKDWEDRAIALMIRLCERHACRVHIVHLSSAGAIPQIVDAKSRGLPLSVETAQHYLFFNAEDISDGRPEFKCAPPIRERSNNEMLWMALKNGVIDFVATDHSPAPPSLKELESGNIKKAWGGISSIQFALPALWTAGLRYDISLPEISSWLCSHPAILAGWQETKGRIEPGFDADFVVWNPEENFVVSEAIIHHRHKASPYVGQSLNGVVHQTYIAGENVYDKGRFTALNTGKILLKVTSNHFQENQ